MVLHFREATGIFAKTLPFVLLRIGVGFLFGLLTILYFGLVAGLLYFLRDSISAFVVAAVFLLSAGAFLKVIQLARKYVLYLVSAGHIAVIAHIVDTGEVPENQVSYGKEKVTSNFASASGLFVVDKLVQGVLNQFNQAVIQLKGLVGFIPQLKNILTILRKAITLAGRYLDEAILAHIFLHEDKNNWTGARDGLVLYAKTWKSVLGSTVAIVLGMYVIGFIALLALSPLAVVIGSLSTVGEIIGWAVVLGMVATIHFGVVQPWVKTVVITTYLIEAEDETPDSETMDFLEEKSSKFREVAENAAGKATGSEKAPETPDTPGEGTVG